MISVSFSFNDVINSMASWIYNHVDNISLYQSKKNEWLGGTVTLIQAPYSHGNGHDDGGSIPTIKWVLNQSTAPQDQHTLTESAIASHIRNFINISSSQQRLHPSADDLIQLFNHISQFCIATLKFHRQVFSQSAKPSGATSAFVKTPATYLSYTPPPSNKHSSSNYSFSDIIFAETADQAVQNIITATSKHIPSVTIQYSFTFNRKNE